MNQKIIKNGKTSYQNDIYKDTPGNAEIERLLAKIDSIRNGKDKQIVLISSSIRSEGKSTIASRIARSSAHNRKKTTLLIDCDIRRPKLHNMFGVNKEPGIGNMLDTDMHLIDCIRKTMVPNLHLLTAGGSKNKRPIELLNSERINKIVEESRIWYDYVFIDSPPIIYVSDPLILAKLVDEVVLVLKAGWTSKFVVKRSIDMLKDVKVQISGIVINNMDNVLPYYYDYHYYGYQYYDEIAYDEQSDVC